MDIFLSTNDWHRMGDILSLTYVLLLIIHLSSSLSSLGNGGGSNQTSSRETFSIALGNYSVKINGENQNHILRYLAFSLAWIAKLKDGWDSIFYEVLLLVLLISLVLLRNFPTVLSLLNSSSNKSYTPHNKRLNYPALSKAMISLVIFLLLFALLEVTKFGNDTSNRTGRVLHGLIAGGGNVAGGSALYWFWGIVPIRKFREEDGEEGEGGLPLMASSSGFI